MTTDKLILDVSALRRAVARGEQFEFVHFWGHKPGPGGALSDGCFSQWWPCRFEIDGQVYSTAEQWMMAGKARLFGDEEMLGKILVTEDPGKVKALGRKVRGFNDSRWKQARFDLVTRGNVAKFGQDGALKKYLLATGDTILVEASPTDTIWGIGLAKQDSRANDPAKWRGSNLLGFALVRARAILRGDLPNPFAG